MNLCLVVCIRNGFKSNLKSLQPSILLRETKTWGFIKQIQGTNFRFRPKVPSKNSKGFEIKIEGSFLNQKSDNIGANIKNNKHKTYHSPHFGYSPWIKINLRHCKQRLSFSHDFILKLQHTLSSSFNTFDNLVSLLPWF
jgi:hypothetical protein